MSIGNQPSLTNNVAAKTISVTASGGQTLFTVTGGYRINQISVYRNGTRLVDSLDYTARDGATVTLLSPASTSDVIEFQVFDDFRAADALNVNSGGTVNGNVTVTGSVTAGSFSGNITGTAATFTGNVTVGGTLTYEDVTNIDSVGLITARSGAIINTGTATTALIVNGDARVTGILTIGTSSITLDGSVNQVNVGTGVTIHHTNGVQVGNNTLHSTGLTVNNLNSSGIITATTFRVGTAVTINSSGMTVGIITATSFSGDGSGLTGVGGTANVRTNTLVVSGVSTVAAGSASVPSISPTGDNNTGIFFPAADTIAFAEGSTESARFDSSGRLIVGATASINDNEAGIGYPNKVQIESSSANNGLTVRNIGNVSRLNIVRLQDSMASGTHVGYLGFGAHVASGPSIERARISGYTDTTVGPGGYGGQLRFEVSDDGAASVTERARMERNGRFSLNYSNLTGAISDYSGGIYSFHNATNSNSTTLGDQKATWFIRGSLQNTNNELANNILLMQDTGGAAVNPGDMIKAYRGSTLVFRVDNGGSVRNLSGTYTTLSDERAKQDIIDASSAWDDVKSLRIRKFRLKSEVERHTENPHLGDAPYFLGVIAQEVEQVCPNLVVSPKLDDGSPDPDALKEVKQSIIYMKAVKALQEAQERIETLEDTISKLSDRISALENP